MISAILALTPMLLPLACIILIAIFYALVFRKKLLQTYFLSVVTIIFILFLCGILNFKGSLLLGYVIIIAFSLFALGFSIRAFIKNRKSIKDISLILGLLIFGSFIILALFLNYRRMFTNWDEFSHWGVVVKSMYTYDALGTYKDAILLFKAYLPGASLFQYFWVRPFPQFTEFLTVIASNVIFFSILANFIKTINWRTILCTITALFIPLLMGTHFYTSLYVDCLMGILLASSLISYYYYRYEKSFYGILIVCIFLGILTLIKDMGFIFAGIAFMIMFFDSIFFRRSSIQKYLISNGSFVKKIKKILTLLLPLIVILSLQLLWRIHMAKAGITSPWLTTSLRDVVGNILNNNLLPYQYDVIALFKDALVNKKIWPLDYSSTTILTWILITGLPLIVFLRKKGTSIKRLLFSFLGIIAGGFIYTGILFFFYIFAMAPYESSMLSGYARYMFSYIIGIFFYYLIFIILKNKKILRSKIILQNFFNYFKLIIIAVTTIWIYVFLWENTTKPITEEIFNVRKSSHESIEEREIYSQCLIWKPYLSDPTKKPYIITQYDFGLMKLKLMYTLYPTKIHWISDYSVGLKPYYPEQDDPWTKIVTPEEWGKYVIANYDLVYIFTYDQLFKDTYGRFFDDVKANGLYQVTLDNAGMLRLVSIPVPQ